MSDYLKTGYLNTSDLEFPDESVVKQHFVAVTECVQEIPCNPCVESCPVDAIKMEGINGVPHVDFKKCIGCGNCVAVCPGLAMFLVNIKEGKGRVSLLYEMLPLPNKGDTVNLLDRKGKIVGVGTVISIRQIEKDTTSSIITVEFDDPSLIKVVKNVGVIRNE